MLLLMLHAQSSLPIRFLLRLSWGRAVDVFSGFAGFATRGKQIEECLKIKQREWR